MWLWMRSVKVPALELFLHEMIPLAKAMGVGVEVSDDRALVLTAPKEQKKTRSTPRLAEAWSPWRPWRATALFGN
jgi:hypothetical protein